MMSFFRSPCFLLLYVPYSAVLKVLGQVPFDNLTELIKLAKNPVVCIFKIFFISSTLFVVLSVALNEG
ncbi:hypothetical protein HYQ46_007213 [Verticillium longisporum]|nr:hypothetical protein HYQ46_007213 [Verticillium longisporum]